MPALHLGMTPEVWAKVKTILEGALVIEPSERPFFLETACRGDDDLRREVESLLAAGNTDLLERPVVSFDLKFEDDASALEGRVIGNYRLTAELGSGGMGAVFLAERADGTFEQRTALKLIRRGIYSDTVLQRFLNERRILASLRHPNIARLLDAGTSGDGVPYFVMEYVEGKPITEYVEDRNPDLRERLELFRKVCSAVSYAHQNLVIHRDLKPSNILVGASGEPKLLDFGIAKLLNTGSGSASATQQFALTPDYSSPEQLRGEKLSTATDVYSLGIILYELLTGQRPYGTEGRNYGEIVRIVCETVPEKPSAAAEMNQRFSGLKNIPGPRLLRGDIDNIVLKALRKEPEKRYASVEQFSTDIRRYLEGMPVRASRGTWSYRAQKFLSRNRYRVTAGALVLMSLVGGLAATLYQSNAARRERVRAERRFNDLRKLASSFTFEINEEIGKSPIRARELLVTRAIEYLDRLVQEGGGDPELLGELADAYEKIGDLQAKLFNPSLGKTADALASHRKALEIRERLFAADTRNISLGLDVMRSRMYVGDISVTKGGIADGRENYQSAIRLGEQLLAQQPAETEVARLLGRLHARAGQAILRSGSLAEAERHYDASLAAYSGLLAKNPSDIGLRRSVGIVSSYIGYVKLELLEPEEAARFYRSALETAVAIESADPQNLQYRSDTSAARLWLGVALSQTGHDDEALAQVDAALTVQKALFNSDRANRGEQNSVADCYLERGNVLMNAGRFDAAAEAYREAAANYEAVWKADPANLAARRQLAHSKCRLAETLAKKGLVAKAAASLFSVLEEHKALAAIDQNNIEWQHDLAICNLRIGELLISRGEQARASGHIAAARRILENLTSASPENRRLRRDLDLAERLTKQNRLGMRTLGRVKG